MSQPARIERLNPRGLHAHPAYTQAVIVSGPVKTVYVGGQNAVTASGDLVGRGDLRAQTAQVLRNLEIALAEAGVQLADVVKWTVLVVDGQPVEAGFEVFTEVWGGRGEPPLITLSIVQGLAHPDFLVELDAVAVVPDDQAG